MKRWIFLLCLGTLPSLNSAELQEQSDVKESKDNIDYSNNSGEIDDQESGLYPNSTEAVIYQWSGRRDALEKHHEEEEIWNVIRREVEEIKDLLPILANNISTSRFSVNLSGDVSVIKKDVARTKVLSHVIWTNLTEARKDDVRMMEMLSSIVDNMSIATKQAGKAKEYMTFASRSVNSKFGAMVTKLKAGFEKVDNDTRTLSKVVLEVRDMVSKLSENVSLLFPRRDRRILSKVSAVHVAIEDQTKMIKTVRNTVNNQKNLFHSIDYKTASIKKATTKVYDRIEEIPIRVKRMGKNMVNLVTYVRYLAVHMGDMELNISNLAATMEGLYNSFNEVCTLNMKTMHDNIISDVKTTKTIVKEVKLELSYLRRMMEDQAQPQPIPSARRYQTQTNDGVEGLRRQTPEFDGPCDCSTCMNSCPRAIFIALEDIKDQIFKEINKVAWITKVIGGNILNAIYKSVYEGRPLGKSGRRASQYPMPDRDWEEPENTGWLVEDYLEDHPGMIPTRRHDSASRISTTTEVAEKSTIPLRTVPKNTPDNVKKKASCKKKRKRRKNKKTEYITTAKESKSRAVLSP